MSNHKNVILQLQTLPASNLGLNNGGLTQYRKELIKVGKYIHPADGQPFEVTPVVLAHFARTFDLYIKNGNKVPITLNHDWTDSPEDNQGWVTNMVVEGNSLFGIMGLVDPKLALTTDVSIGMVVGKKMDGKGNVYNCPITHVALCVDPVIGGLENFEVLSLSIGDVNMKFVEKIAKALGLSNDAPTEELVASEVEKLMKNPLVVKTEGIELSNKSSSNSAVVVKMLSRQRAQQLDMLLQTGIIIPAVKDAITAKYVETGSLTLSMSKGDDGFDFWHDILVQNKAVKLNGITGVQNLELSNARVDQKSELAKLVDKRRKAAGLKD